MKRRIVINNYDSGIWDSTNKRNLIWYSVEGQANTGDGWHTVAKFGGDLSKLVAQNKAEHFRKMMKAGKTTLS